MLLLQNHFVIDVFPFAAISEHSLETFNMEPVFVEVGKPRLQACRFRKKQTDL